MKTFVSPAFFNSGTNYVLRVDQAIRPSANDGAALGISSTAFSDLFLASGAVINFNAGDITLTHSSNLLTVGGGNVAFGTGTLTAAAILANSNNSGALGASGTAFSDLFLADGGVINFNAGDVTLTHAAGQVTVGGGDLIIADSDDVNSSAAEGWLALGTGGDSRLFYDGTNSYWDLHGVGTGGLMLPLAGSFPSPDGGVVHIWEGSAGAITANSGAQLIIENSGEASINLLTANDQESNIYFGDPENSAACHLKYAHATDTWSIRIQTVYQLIVDESLVTISPNALVQSGIRIGADSGNNEIDDATQGAASTTLYIGNASITVSSDKRVKSNIQAWDGQATDLLSQLSVKDFDYDADHVPFGGIYDGRYVGLMAQDVFKVAPWAVNTQGGADCQNCLSGMSCEEHPQPWSVKAELMTGIMVKTMQELERRISLLEE